MPHLNETESKESKSAATLKNNKSSQGISESIPTSAVKESRESAMNGVDQLLSVAATATATATKQQTDERRSPEECTPSHSSQKQMITPSPHTGAPGSRPREQGPMLSIYGNSRIYTSPIRVKTRSPTSEAVKQESDATLALPPMEHPSNLLYGSSPSSWASPPPRRISYGRVSCYEEQVDKKRPVESPDITEMVKRARTKESVQVEDSSVKETGAQQELNATEQSKSTFVIPTGRKKKAIISPSNSGEKGEEDESSGGSAQQGAAYPPGARPYPHAPYPPPHTMHPYGMRPPYGAPMPPPYGHGHPMYNSYPPPPPHYMDGRHCAPPSYYTPYPPHPHPMMHHYRHPSQFPPPYPGVPPPAGLTKIAAAGSVKQSSRTNSPHGGDDGNCIKSVAEWQKAALATGKAPSANRCLPLKEPIPSKYWG
jgi:hypothetical protein